MLHAIIPKHSPVEIQPQPASLLPSFARRLVSIPDFLPDKSFQMLRQEILGLVQAERSYLPTHKKGATIAYEALRAAAPHSVAFYHAPELQLLLSEIVGERLMPTPLRDKSSLSVLFYEKPGDHIGWHYDHNFYRGRHFTVLLAIENRGRDAGDLSAARLMVKQDGAEVLVLTPPNTLVLFEGAKILHRVTAVDHGERRVILSMTYGTRPENSLTLEMARRIKDTAYFGLRALWS